MLPANSAVVAFLLLPFSYCILPRAHGWTCREVPLPSETGLAANGDVGAVAGAPRVQRPGGAPEHEPILHRSCCRSVLVSLVALLIGGRHMRWAIYEYYRIENIGLCSSWLCDMVLCL